MRHPLIVLSMLLLPLNSAHGDVSFGMAVPGLSIGINVPAYPDLVPVPGYPVYYDPQLDANYFFYDGLYWVLVGDNWYESSWYNGPWQLVEPDDVPLFLLRVPVRYYRRPPVYFRGWRADAPPHWGRHWGRGWQQRHGGWQHSERRPALPPAPLPSYQRQYSGERYPGAPQQQHSIQAEHYRYQPREPITRQRFRQQGNPGGTRVEQQMRQQQNARQDKGQGNKHEERDHDHR
ncbi:MAG: hypothetical protein WBP86_04240 [Thiobacillaceae bacterium]